MRGSIAKHAGQKKMKLKSLRKTKSLIRMSQVQPTEIVNETIEEQEQEEHENMNEDDEEVIQDQDTIILIRKEDIKELKEVLSAIGFRQYLEDPVLGLCKNTDTVTHSLLSLARFLLWTHLSVKKVPLALNNDAVLLWSKILIVKKPSLVHVFQGFLVEVLKFSPGSIINFICHLKEYAEWFRMFRSTKNTDSFKIKLCKYTKFMTICSRVMKGARKLRTNRLKKKTGSQTNAMDEAIANRQLPQGGLKELQDAVMSEMDWILGSLPHHLSVVDQALSMSQRTRN